MRIEINTLTRSFHTFQVIFIQYDEGKKKGRNSNLFLNLCTHCPEWSWAQWSFSATVLCSVQSVCDQCSSQQHNIRNLRLFVFTQNIQEAIQTKITWNLAFKGLWKEWQGSLIVINHSFLQIFSNPSQVINNAHWTLEKGNFSKSLSIPASNSYSLHHRGPSQLKFVPFGAFWWAQSPEMNSAFDVLPTAVLCLHLLFF